MFNEKSSYGAYSSEIMAVLYSSTVYIENDNIVNSKVNTAFGYTPQLFWITHNASVSFNANKLTLTGKFSTLFNVTTFSTFGINPVTNGIIECIYLNKI